jgi:N-acetylglucosaminyldiphosphoundecaprenol N-acetyl-beta-D-mannosaminyltransferase
MDKDIQKVNQELGPSEGFIHRWATVLEKITVITTGTEEVALIERLTLKNETPVVLAFVNAHAMNMLVSNTGFFVDLTGGDCLLRDGSGMSLLFRQLGLEPGMNMNGTDLIPRILENIQGKRLALWGTSDESLLLAQERLTLETGLEVVSIRDGFQNEAKYLTLFDECRPEVIVLGMGMPKQERVARKLREHAQGDLLIICGGAIIDFIGGRVSRAPRFFRHLGLEWLYRLMLEPRRLFKRYIVGNPLFIARTLLFRWSGKVIRD